METIDNTVYEIPQVSLQIVMSLFQTFKKSEEQNLRLWASKQLRIDLKNYSKYRHVFTIKTWSLSYSVGYLYVHQ